MQQLGPHIFMSDFGIQVTSYGQIPDKFYPLSVYDDTCIQHLPFVRINDDGSLSVYGNERMARRIFAKALVNLGSYITIQGSDGSVLAQICSDLGSLCSTSLSREAHSFICLACYEAEQMRKANSFSPDVPTNSALESKQAPKCECGGRSMGARDYRPGHSDWCDVSHTKGK